MQQQERHAFIVLCHSDTVHKALLERIVVSAFRNWAWGQHFAVSTWFMRNPDGAGNYEGIINNGYYTHGSWEIRMGREMGTHRLA